MKKVFSMVTLSLLLATGVQAQRPQFNEQTSEATARKFTLNLTEDGRAQMVCFLPKAPCGKAIVGIPGGGYSVLSNTHEGTLAHGWLNEKGIAYFVVDYLMATARSLLAMWNRVSASFVTRLRCGVSIHRRWASWASRQVAICRL